MGCEGTQPRYMYLYIGVTGGDITEGTGLCKIAAPSGALAVEKHDRIN